MLDVIKNGKDFRIIPENFESSTICNQISINKDEISFELPIASADEMKDYNAGEEVEIFASSYGGLVYFVTKILSKEDKTIKVQMPKVYKNIQRREYSRVGFEGTLTFKDYKDAVLKTIDISAGGLKFVSNFPFDEQLEYNISIGLSNNLTIKCSMQPIRIQQIDFEGQKAYSISGKFKNIESIDRIALVQYTFRAMTEAENMNSKN